MEDDEFGEIGYAVIDVEALILGPVVRVVEQIAFVIMSAATGEEVLAEKYMIYQPYDISDLCYRYNQPFHVVSNSVMAYRRITGDEPVHADVQAHFPWNAVKNRIRKILRRRAIKVYAKGAALERTVFSNTLTIADLEDTQCPKYPYSPHDPLAECRFFADYVPELQHFHAQPTER
jgi:hypothetical protein